MTKSRNHACSHSHGSHTNACIIGEGPLNDSERGFRFGRIMPQGSFQPLILKESAARKIGKEMTNCTNSDDSKIPAGYTYFGQFVDHDITFDTTDSQREADNPDTDEIEPTPDSRI